VSSVYSSGQVYIRLAYINHFTSVAHIQRLYSEASRETAYSEARLIDIEITIGSEGVQRLEAESASRGGEQYQPDETLIQGNVLALKSRFTLT